MRRVENLSRPILFAMVLWSLFIPATLSAQNSKQIRLARAYINGYGTASPSLVLEGENLGPAALVSIGSAGGHFVPLELLSSSPTQLVARLGSPTPGTYVVYVAMGNGSSQNDQINVTIGGWGVAGAQGPKGDPGPQGPAGPAGPAGAPGAQGPAGPAGAQGLAGPSGAQGAIGQQGPKGDAGAQGPAGPAGAQGEVGPKGETGAQGAKGDLGAQGPKGDIGPQGPAGAAGATGSTGPAGAAGATGSTGSTGATGATGATGGTGAQGPPGPAGEPGSGRVLFEKSWSTQSSATPGATSGMWWPVPGARVPSIVTAGGPLLISMSVYMAGGGHATCRPVIDGVWAGDFAQLSKSPDDPYWTEGLIAVGLLGNGYQAWSKSRVYFGVPAGTHTFTIQCATDDGQLTIGSDPQVRSSWSVIELR